MKHVKDLVYKCGQAATDGCPVRTSAVQHGCKIAIVLGVGKGIGVHAVQTLRSNGFKVARVSRSVTEEELDDVLSIP